MQFIMSSVMLCVISGGNVACFAGRMVYHGPREDILPFFEQQGMHCPERKADSDFLQEVTSRKDQKVPNSGLVFRGGHCYMLLASWLSRGMFSACYCLFSYPHTSADAPCSCHAAIF